MAYPPLMRLHRLALATGLLVMPDDRPASRIAMMRLVLLHWRGDTRRRARRIVRRYAGAQRVWIELGTGVAIYAARHGWWQIPLLAAAVVMVLWLG